MTVEFYLNMSDLDLQTAVAYNQGSYFHHPFTDTALIELCEDDPEPEEEEWINEDQSDRDLFDLNDIQELLESESAAD